MVTMFLREDNKLIETWSDSGTDILTISETAPIEKNHTYMLEVIGTIGGEYFTIEPIVKKIKQYLFVDKIDPK